MREHSLLPIKFCNFAKDLESNKHSMKDNLEELLPVVDTAGNVIDAITRAHAHDGSKTLHPVVHLHVFDSKGRLYLQHRPAWKDIQPDKWDTAVGGHIDLGESVQQALCREAKEELGISGFEAKQLGHYVFESSKERELVYAFRCIYNQDIQPNDNELSGGRFWSAQEIADSLGKGIFTPNFEKEYATLLLPAVQRTNLFIFDFDGTLGDTRSLILQTMMDTFDQLGISRPDTETCVSTIGLPLAQCFEVAAGLSKAESQQCAEAYRDIFQRNKATYKLQPFEGVMETLHAIHAAGKTMAIASSRQHASLTELVADLGVSELFACVVGGNDVTLAKPHPEPVERILHSLNMLPSETIVVGDAPYDILMGRNAGVKTCGVSYGNSTREALQEAGADHVLDHFADLLSIKGLMDTENAPYL